MKTIRNNALRLTGCVFLASCATFGCGRKAGTAPNAKALFAAQERVLKLGRGDRRRFYALGETAKLAAECGAYGKAQQYATELLRAAPKYRHNWNFGNAIHDSHMVLGRVALAQGNAKAAARHLLAAGKTPGSPQLNSFGPNMSLARDLIAKGDKQDVMTYLDECKLFWKGNAAKLDDWKSQVEQGQTPDFGPNLRY